MSSFKATWLGDGDPSAQFIRLGDLAFVKGEGVSVPGDHEFAQRIKENPTFATAGEKADPVEAAEPDVEEQEAKAEEGTEKGALKAQLRGMGVDIGKGNPSVETLRAKLVEATK